MRAAAREIFAEAVRAADPRASVLRHLRREGDRLLAGGEAYDLAAAGRVIVVGAGKGTAPMAEAVEEIAGDRIDAGLVIVKDGHARPLARIEQAEASHPLPDERGRRATERLLGLVAGAGEADLVLCLLSGGASSLLVAPDGELTLEDKRAASRLLMGAGADIAELNTVRKHLSRVKGGRLAEAAAPAAVLTLAVSDVIGDRLDVIGSGPTYPDGTTFAEALAVLERRAVAAAIPEKVRRHLELGAAGRIAETPKGGGPAFARTRNLVVGSNREAIGAAAARARGLGYEPEVVTTELAGEAREAAARLAGLALRRRQSLGPGGKACLLAGGETTVTVRGRGLGGRNQELALAFAVAIEGEAGIAALAGGTDGTDGPNDAAGGVVDGETAALARAVGLDPARFLAENDSYSFFAGLDRAAGGGHHLVTGPTGTNVMDIVAVLVSGDRGGAGGRD